MTPSDAAWIDYAAREMWKKQIVPSDAHAEAARLIIRANYEAHAAHLAKLDTSGLAERIAKRVLAIVVNDECPTMEDHHQECEVLDRYNAWPEHYRDPISAELAPVLEQQEQFRQAWIKENDEIEQILGKALGYPWFKDDMYFPGATEEDGVFVGEHVPATLAMEAAKRITALEEALRECRPIIQSQCDSLQQWLCEFNSTADDVPEVKVQMTKLRGTLSRIDALLKENRDGTC